MILYYFNPNDYDKEYFVMAESITKAHEALISYFEKEVASNKDVWLYTHELERWKNVVSTNKATYPEKYTITAHSAGEVIETEIA